MGRARIFELRSEIPVSARELFRAHTRPGAFERLLPPWERAVITRPAAELRAGEWLELRMGVGPFSVPWVAEIASVSDEGEAGGGFVDRALEGPFAHWLHRHSMRALGPGRAELVDRVEYALPCGALAAPLAPLVRRRLARAFAYRHRVTAADLARHAELADRPRLDVLVSGSSGLVGSALCAFLEAGGHRVRRLVRRAPRSAGEFHWDTHGGAIDPRAAEGADAVVHLAGENIAARRWSRAQKERIAKSRREGTRAVTDAVRAVRSACRGPRVFLSASATGIYADGGERKLDETSAAGTSFLARTCADWERAARDLTGVRGVQLRFGVVLSPRGGALAKMLPPFRLGLGGPVGGGRQWVPWIALDDAVYALHHALFDEELAGPVNVVAPAPVTNAELTRTLGRVLGRPALMPLPAAGARAHFGELAGEVLLASRRVLPRRLGTAGFRCSYPDLEGALRHLLGRAPA